MELDKIVDTRPSWRNSLAFSTYVGPFEVKLDEPFTQTMPSMNEEDYMSQLLMGFELYINSLDDPELIRNEQLQFEQYCLGVLEKMFAKFNGDDRTDIIEILSIDQDSSHSLKMSMIALYGFLYVERYLNVLNYIKFYIKKHFKRIATTYRETTDPKTLQLIRQSCVGDKFDARIIVCNLSDIIDSIVDDDNDPETFIQQVINIDVGRLSNYVLSNDEFFNLSPTFIQTYLRGVINSTDTRSMLILQVGEFFNNIYSKNKDAAENV